MNIIIIMIITPIQYYLISCRISSLCIDIDLINTGVCCWSNVIVAYSVSAIFNRVVRVYCIIGQLPDI